MLQDLGGSESSPVCKSEGSPRHPAKVSDSPHLHHVPSSEREIGREPAFGKLSLALYAPAAKGAGQGTRVNSAGEVRQGQCWGPVAASHWSLARHWAGVVGTAWHSRGPSLQDTLSLLLRSQLASRSQGTGGGGREGRRGNRRGGAPPTSSEHTQEVTTPARCTGGKPRL